MADGSNEGVLPSKKGVREAIEIFRKLREKRPSPELVRIIKDVTEQPQPVAGDDRDDIAAIGLCRPDKDLGR